jgi:hypothetical protein
MIYFCSECRKECTPRLCEVGIEADCHEEAPVMVEGDWQVDESTQMVSPPVYLRPLTDREESDLTEELWRENDSESTPAMRARDRVMGGS